MTLTSDSSGLRGLRVLCAAGEASGDALLGPLVARWTREGASVFGLGGPLSVAGGLTPVTEYGGLAAHGFTEALPALPRTLRALADLKRSLNDADAVVLVDFPEVSLRLLRAARARGTCPVAYLAPPQAWAWRAGRAGDVAEADWVGCLFDFERAWYTARGAHAEWVGHPLADQAPPPLVSVSGPTDLAVLPGSRRGSVTRIAGLMADALRPIALGGEALRAHIGLAPGLDVRTIAPLRALSKDGVDVIIHTSAPSALAASHAALVAVGTATLECALAQRPFVAVGALSWLSTQVARRLVRVPHFALPNLVLGRAAFRECVGAAATAPTIARAIHDMLSDLPRGQADCAAVLEAMRARPEVASPGAPFDARVAARIEAIFTRAHQVR